MEQFSLFDDVPKPRDRIFNWDGAKGAEKIMTLPSGRTVFHEGARPDHVFEVLGGTLKLSKATEDGRQLILGFPAAGEIIGLGGTEEYLHTAETVSTVKLFPILRKTVERRFLQNAETAARLFDWMGKQQTASANHVSLLANTHVPARVASFLLNYVRKHSAGNGGCVMLDLPMTQRDIASYLSIAPETYSRTLRKFREAGILRPIHPGSNRGGQVICSVAKLQAIALGENIQPV